MDRENPAYQTVLEKVSVQSRGIYLLPNFMTTASLFAGFYAIVTAMHGAFSAAAIAIFIAIVIDGLDGRVARLTHTQTAFGAQYDSLADMVSFGIAPALMMYSWVLHDLGQLGWLTAFLYAAATALRLARFNTQSHDEDRQYFQGLPCPSAAGVLVSFMWVSSGYSLDGRMVTGAILLIIVVSGLMVSTIRYYSFKNVGLKGKVSFFTIVMTVWVLAAIALKPPEILCSIFLIYACSGVVITLRKVRKARKHRLIERNKHKT